MWPYLPDPNGSIPTYYFLASLAFALSTFWIAKRTKIQKLNLQISMDLSLVVMISSFIGGRLGQVLFEQPLFYFHNPLAIFKFWDGGFVFYGGLLGSLLGISIFYHFIKFEFWKYADLFAPVIAFGYGLGRLGCFFAGCCYGRPTPLPWGIIFPSFGEAPAGIPIHPTQLYSVFWEWSVMTCLLFLEKKGPPRSHGFIFGLWLILHGLGRTLIEQFRDDFRGQNVFNLSISTWISFTLVAFGFCLIFKKRKIRVPTSL